MSIFTRILAGITVLALLCVGVILVSSDTSEDTFEEWFEQTFHKTFEELQDTWSQAFEQSWRETFGDNFDEELKTRFEKSFRAVFEESFKRVFDKTWREASEDFDKEASAKMGEEEEGILHDGDQIVWKDKLTFDEPAVDLDRLELDTINGDVEITDSDADTVHIVAFRVVRSTDEEEGEKYREEFRPIVQRKGSTLVVETHRPEKNKSKPRHIKEAKMTYAVSLPSRFEVQAKTVNGSVKVEDIQNKASLHTVNGSVELAASEGLHGEVQAKTVNGKIYVRAPRLMGKTSMETVNGSIEIKASDAFEAELRAKTVNGSIELSVPRDAAFHLNAHTAMSGSIHTDWGEPGKSDSWFGKSYEVDVNGGGEHVDLETLNGSIRVEQVD